MKQTNTPQIVTERVILRKFQANDLDDMAELYSDKTVNRFLPWFPHASRKETELYLNDVVLKEYEKPIAYCYAAQLKESGKVIGYVVLHDIDPVTGCGDLGYAFMKEYWGQGLAAECCSAVINRLKTDGFAYITATHDKRNVQSGRVMQKIGMQYKYSYVEQWQPKNTEVTFRMYQLNFDGSDRTHLAFWDKYPIHFVEDNITTRPVSSNGDVLRAGKKPEGGEQDMKRYVAMLRGINISGKNKIAMIDLKGCFEALGYTDVTTHLNSGNVIFSSAEPDRNALTLQAEQAVKRRFDLDIPIFIIAQKDLAERLDHAPDWWGNDDSDIYDNMIFILPPLSYGEIYDEIGEPKAEYEKAYPYKDVIFWSFSRTHYQKTNWWAKTANSKISRKITVRTANTTRKIVIM